MLCTPRAAFRRWESNGLGYLAGHHYNNGKPVFALHQYPGDAIRRIEEIADYVGIELRYDDEIVIDDLGRVHETRPAYVGQRPTYVILGDEVWAKDEVDNDTLAQYAGRLTVTTDSGTEPQAVDYWGTDFSPLGFCRFYYQAKLGFNSWQHDRPEKLLRLIAGEHGDCEVIFAIDEIGQFHVRYSAWYRPRANANAEQST